MTAAVQQPLQNEQQQQQQHRTPGADMFLLFYIKRRIEQRVDASSAAQHQLEWFEAPYCCEEVPPPEWFPLEQAALLFEQDNRTELEQQMIRRLEPIGKLNFRSFRMIVRHYLDALSQRGDKSVALLALIAFTGMYARRLAELDFAQANDNDDDEYGEDQQQQEQDERDFRREITQVSIYGSRILLSTLDDTWEMFCADVAKMLEQIREQEDAQENHRHRRQLLPAGFPPLIGIGLPLVAALCGVGAAAYFLIRRH